MRRFILPALVVGLGFATAVQAQEPDRDTPLLGPGPGQINSPPTGKSGAAGDGDGVAPFVVVERADEPEVAAVLDGALVLAQDKVFLGPRLRVDGGIITGGVDAIFLYKGSDRDDDGHDGVFLGNLFSFALGARVRVVQDLWLSAGTGFDAWYLWGIDLNEAKFAMPLWVEARYWVNGWLGAFLNTRYNLLASGGLDFGATREDVGRGQEGSVPLMFTIGVGVRQ
jgi:hypothetical protein